MAIVAAWFSVLAFAAEASARKWTDRSGSYSIEAQLIARSADKVQLQTGDGKRFTVVITSLCDADRQYLASLCQPPPRITRLDGAF